jgi:hypothetical protein
MCRLILCELSSSSKLPKVPITQKYNKGYPFEKHWLGVWDTAEIMKYRYIIEQKTWSCNARYIFQLVKTVGVIQNSMITRTHFIAAVSWLHHIII